MLLLLVLLWTSFRELSESVSLNLSALLSMHSNMLSVSDSLGLSVPLSIDRLALPFRYGRIIMQDF